MKKMKKRIFPLAALLLCGALCTSAAAAPDRLLLERDSRQALYSREADDFLNFDIVREGGSRRLGGPVYTDGGDYALQVRTAYGSGSLSAEVTAGGVSVKTRRLRPENEPLEAKYTYYLLTLSPAADVESDAPEDFSIALQCGEKSITLLGTLKKSEVLPIFEGLRYPLGSGRFFRFDEPLKEEAAQVACAPGLTLSFLGDYGGYTADLQVKTDIPEQAAGLLGTDLACWRFTDSPVFESPLTVKLAAPEEAVIYELRNGRLYRLETEYEQGGYREEGYHRFETKALGTYVYQKK